MEDERRALVQVTTECVQALRAEMHRRHHAGTLDADETAMAVDAAMARLMGAVGEVAGPHPGVEAFFPVVLTLLFVAVARPILAMPVSGTN